MPGRLFVTGLRLCARGAYGRVRGIHQEFSEKDVSNSGRQPDYTSVVNERHFDRLNGYIEQAKDAGADVVEINPAGEDFRQQPATKLRPPWYLTPVTTWR